jgi:hypothetical protein
LVDTNNQQPSGLGIAEKGCPWTWMACSPEGGGHLAACALPITLPSNTIQHASHGHRHMFISADPEWGHSLSLRQLCRVSATARKCGEPRPGGFAAANGDQRRIRSGR